MLVPTELTDAQLEPLRLVESQHQEGETGGGVDQRGSDVPLTVEAQLLSQSLSDLCKLLGMSK